ncbi:MAG: secretin N-terminal domain-containing protein [Kiritimatiellia bacterium]|jgi:type II secretory pathway component GspD/PulD (secretin)|nr:secretin N-terminal domain-containing protein [Kiritimatiellia bacterium]
MNRISRLCAFVAASLCLAWQPVTRAEEAAAPAPVPANTPSESGAKPPQSAKTTASVRVTDASSSSEPLVSMTFDEAPLADVIKAFRDATGANIISGGTNVLQANISVSLDNVPWRKGLSSILDPQGLQLVEQPAGSGIYVINTKTVEVPKITRVFSLEYIKAEDVADLLKTTLGTTGGIVTPFKEANAVILTATEQQITECETIIKAIDKASPQVYIEVRFVELNAAASRKLGLKWDSLGTKEGWGVHAGTTSFGFQNDYLKTKDKGTDRSRSFESGDTRSLVNDILDIEENDVSQSALTRTVKSNDGFTQARAFTGTLSLDAFSLAMNAFEQMDGVSIFSNPKIIVANEKEAVVDMSQKEPNLTVTSSRSGTAGDQLDISAELEVIPGEKGDKDGKGKGLFAGEAFFSYGITLKVTPRISSTGLITLNVEPSISKWVRDYEFKGVSDSTPTPTYPIIYMQRLQTVFTMNSGTTAVIGGLTTTTENNIDSGIPWLRELPWVGSRLFGWKSRAKEQKEIIIFVSVGLADPLKLPESVGMPKNAILGRDLLTGELKEPGDRTKEEVMSLRDPARKAKQRAPADGTPAAAGGAAAPAAVPAALVTESEAAKTAQPVDTAPLLQNP